MKKNLLFFIILLLFVGCQSEKPSKKFYKATKDGNVALLTLNVGKDYFFGHYTIKYGDSGEDSGKIRGTIIGDTLKGKFNYLSYGGSEKIKPFVLLKSGETLKMGSGIIMTYMNIPYYSPETLVFKDSDFEFHQIDIETAKKLKLALE